MDPVAQRDLQPCLGDGEKLLWAGRPQQGLLLRKSDAFMVPFTLFWCGGVIIWETMAFVSGAPLGFLIFGAFFLVIGVYILIGRFFADAYVRKAKLYGITNERVIIRSGTVGQELKSLDLRTLSDLTLVEKGGGKGTIWLGPQTPWSSWSMGFSMPGIPTASPVFEGLSNAKQVYEILRNAQKMS